MIVRLLILSFMFASCIGFAQKHVRPKPMVVSSTDTINLEEGLRYILAQENKSGNFLKLGDRVSIAYNVFFSDGRLFFSTGGESNAITIRLGKAEVVKGLEMGLQKLRTGEKAKFIVPQPLAYGGDQKLYWIYDVEVFNIIPNKSPKPFETNGKDTLHTKSGIKYIIEKKGAGLKPVVGNIVALHYTGYFFNGNIFDSSVEKDEVFSFIVGDNKVIQGWEEAILLMSTGDRVRFIIPPNKAYGEKGNLYIPPNSTLIFDMELISVSENESE